MSKTNETIKSFKKDILGMQVTDIRIGFSTTLELSTEAKFYRIGLGSSEAEILGEKFSIAPIDIRSKLILADFFKSVVSGFEVAENGDLLIEFDNGMKKIRNPASPDYEAWEINTASNLQIICTPGGEITIFE